MLKKYKNLKNTSFRTKLLFSYILLITIPLIISSMIIYKQFLLTYIENSSTMIDQRLNQEVNNINETLNTVEKVAFQLSSNTSLTSFLNERYNPLSMDSYNNLTNKVIPLFEWIKNTNPDINKINILTFNRSISEIDVFTYASAFENQNWFKEMRDKTRLGLPYWEKYHIQRPYRGFDNTDNSSHVYSLFCTITLLYKKNLSYAELQIKPQVLYSSLNLSPIGNSGFLAVLNNKNEIITGNEAPIVKSLIQNDRFINILSESKGRYQYTFDNIDYTISFNKIDRLNAYIVGIIPETEIKDISDKSVKSFLYTITITFIFLIILAVTLGNVFTKKIKKLTSAFHKFQEGDFNTRISVVGSDELDKLCGDFNIMAARIHELINKVYMVEISQKQAELAALQSQIKPHFIYNTLESLKMTAELHDEEEISDGLTALGNLLRQNIHTETHLINIGNELDNIGKYVKLQNRIRNNRIKISYDVDEEICGNKILNLVLQPIIENCIFHGLGDSQNLLHINVTGERINDVISLSIRDDGLGIDEARHKQLNEMLDRKVCDTPKHLYGSSIGLVNVSRRIKLFYGDEFGVRAYSVKNEGTTIIVSIPASEIIGL